MWLFLQYVCTYQCIMSQRQQCGKTTMEDINTRNYMRWKGGDIGDLLDIWGIDSSKPGRNQNWVVFETTAQEIHVHTQAVSGDRWLQIKRDVYGSPAVMNVKLNMEWSDVSKTLKACNVNMALMYYYCIFPLQECRDYQQKRTDGQNTDGGWNNRQGLDSQNIIANVCKMLQSLWLSTQLCFHIYTFFSLVHFDISEYTTCTCVRNTTEP